MSHRHPHHHDAELPEGFVMPPLHAIVSLGMMRAASLLSDELDREFQSAMDLNLSEVMVLVQVRLAGGRLKMADVASTLVVTRGGVTKMVDRLVKSGHLDREPSAEDRRVIYAAITERGIAAIDEARPIMERVTEHRVGRFFGEDQLMQLHDLIHTITCDNEDWTLPDDAAELPVGAEA
jgi:DNA-binding MarR family transcriptional regulator